MHTAWSKIQVFIAILTLSGQKYNKDVLYLGELYVIDLLYYPMDLVGT